MQGIYLPCCTFPPAFIFFLLLYNSHSQLQQEHNFQSIVRTQNCFLPFFLPFFLQTLPKQKSRMHLLQFSFVKPFLIWPEYNSVLSCVNSSIHIPPYYNQCVLLVISFNSICSLIILHYRSQQRGNYKMLLKEIEIFVCQGEQ